MNYSTAKSHSSLNATDLNLQLCTKLSLLLFAFSLPAPLVPLSGAMLHIEERGGGCDAFIRAYYCSHASRPILPASLFDASSSLVTIVQYPFHFLNYRISSHRPPKHFPLIFQNHKLALAAQ